MEQNTTSHNHFGKKEIIGLIVLVVVAILFAVYFTLKHKTATTNQININTPLTEEQKQAILAELAKQSADVKPLTEKEKTAILKELAKQSTATKPLTDAEKQAILTELNKGK